MKNANRKGQILKIAVTGGAASGKSTVCKFFTDNGITVISLDQLAREVVLPGAEGYIKLVDHFGNGIVLADETLDRAMLRRFITEKPELKTIVEGVVQPEIINLMHDLIEKAERSGESVVVVEVPLLYESGLETLFDACLLVCIDSALQIERLMERDGVTKEGAISLINLQMPQAEKKKRAEFIVENTCGYEALLVKTRAVYEKILEKTMNMSKSLDR